MEKIIFTLDDSDGWIPKEYYPVPGGKAVPDWYKKMKSSYAENGSDARYVSELQTIKKCMPVFDAITTGYVIKTHTDIHIKLVDGLHNIEWANDTAKTVTFHPAFQVVNYKNLDLPHGLPKLRNPWGIKTPAGYSCLFISPLHRPPCGITVLEGIVDTDGYTNAVQFPFKVDEGFEGTVPAGTPIMQVIPFKRSSFRMEIGGRKEAIENNAIGFLLRSTWMHAYRNRWRVKKDYL